MAESFDFEGVARLNPLARILATIGFMYRAGRLSELERTVLKEKALENDLYVDAAVRVLQEDRRLDECLDTLRRIVAIHLRNESRRVAAAALHTAGVSASPAPAAGYAAGGGASAAARSSVSATALPLASPTKHRGASPADAGFGARAEGSGFTTRTSPARPSPADLLRASTVAR